MATVRTPRNPRSLVAHTDMAACTVVRTGYFKIATKHVKAPLTTVEIRALIDKFALPAQCLTGLS